MDIKVTKEGTPDVISKFQVGLEGSIRLIRLQNRGR